MQLVSFKGKFTTGRILSAFSFFFSLRLWVRAALASSSRALATPRLDLQHLHHARPVTQASCHPSLSIHGRPVIPPCSFLLTSPCPTPAKPGAVSHQRQRLPSLAPSRPQICVLQNGRPSATIAPAATAPHSQTLCTAAPQRVRHPPLTDRAAPFRNAASRTSDCQQRSNGGGS
ncbi:hypothetical protein PF004_g26627 [Phytophthora fragariae]|uniref:Uncharacterized protein n=1 Tax=Phytophthora fragariae TaxID=53985 RepID=A0A6G0MNM0_9STRA|nr:hypothetical protein PF004_g26627 [Phytophthora fragariae]